MNEATLALLLLGNAIQSLATLRREGAWTDDPARITQRKLPTGGHLRNLAQDERQFWRSTGPELLCRWVMDTTGKIVTRKSIVALAVEMSKSPYNGKMGLHECDN